MQFKKFVAKIDMDNGYSKIKAMKNQSLMQRPVLKYLWFFEM